MKDDAHENSKYKAKRSWNHSWNHMFIAKRSWNSVSWACLWCCSWTFKKLPYYNLNGLKTKLCQQNQLSSCLRSAQHKLWVISKHIVYDGQNMVVLLWIWPGQVLVLGPTKTLRPPPDRPKLLHLALDCFAPCTRLRLVSSRGAQGSLRFAERPSVGNSDLERIPTSISILLFSTLESWPKVSS